MKDRLIYVLLISCIISLSAEAQQAKNIIFMIGDGMGLNQIYAGMTANHNKLNLEQCTYTGLVKTYSANRYITDSAAGGTALATGTKTKNKMIGMAPDSTYVYSGMTYAAKNGMRTGIVVTSPVTHATPASFYAHQASRNMYEEIALDLFHAQIDVIIGGGRNHFEKRSDKKNLSQLFSDKGYQVVYTQADLINIEHGKVLALLADVDMPVASKRGDMLPQSVAQAIELLNQDNTTGFFLMVEGSQIDYQGHNNNDEELILEVLDFDKAVGEALAFAKADGNTLVIITADHETGGFIILDGNFEDGTVKTKFNKISHTGTPVPIFAYGPGADLFTGFMENSAVMNKVKDAMLITK